MSPIVPRLLLFVFVFQKNWKKDGDKKDSDKKDGDKKDGEDKWFE